MAAKQQLQGTPSSDEPRQPLRAAVPGDEPQVDLGLPEARRVGGHPQGARHGQLASAAEREPVDRRNDGLTERLDQIEDVLTALSA